MRFTASGVVALILAGLPGSASRAEEFNPRRLPSVRRALDKAEAEVRRNRKTFDEANEKVFAEAEKVLKVEVDRLSKAGKPEEAVAVKKLLDDFRGELTVASTSVGPGDSQRDPSGGLLGTYRYQQSDGWQATITIAPEGRMIFHDKADSPGTWQPVGDASIRINFNTGTWIEARRGGERGALLVDKTHDGKTGQMTRVPAPPAK